MTSYYFINILTVDSPTVEQIWPGLVTSFNNEPPKIAPRDLELDQPNGFSLFLEPDLVEGVIELQEELYYLIKWKNKEIREFGKLMHSNSFFFVEKISIRF